MVILNKTKKAKLVEKHRVCRSAGSKARGLMFTNESAVKNSALVFEFNSERFQSMHMFFVFYPIDVLFLDERRKVVEMKKEFRPWQVYNAAKKAKYVIELPSNTIIKTKTTVGDRIEWR
ncbi:DUF192 domain-containing protein [archaeon]|nr:DUF192 domain-containing protein [archaeon]